MFKRESKFPSRDRQTDINRPGLPRQTSGRPRRSFPVFLILGFAAGLYVYEMPERPLAPVYDLVERFLTERDTGTHPGRNPRDLASAPAPKPKSYKKKEPVTSRKLTPGSSKKRVGINAPGVITMDLSIGLGFRPVGFRIGAVSRAINLSDRPAKRIHKLPRFSAEKQKYGVIKLGPGREFGFALDLSASGYRMYVDLNRNGNLADDGPYLVNQGKGLFSSRIKLPLNRVSGVRQLKGDYLLWVFTNPGNWKQGRMHYYAMTQLRGELMLKGNRYSVFLADNGPVDGDYRNDGVSVDLNRDGKISRSSEYFPKGSPIMIDGEQYNFRITR